VSPCRWLNAEAAAEVVAPPAASGGDSVQAALSGVAAPPSSGSCAKVPPSSHSHTCVKARMIRSAAWVKGRKT
jgi:hypothetical protein